MGVETGGPSPYISNGTCYYSSGNPLGQHFIPCGNAALGHRACCQLSDECLDNSACYNFSYGTTYLAGCTDAKYKDEICPSKAPWEQSCWVGLIYIQEDRWSPCHQKKEPKSLASPDPCPTPTSNPVVAFSAPSVIPSSGRLPMTAGETILWESGRAPPSPTWSIETAGSTSGTASIVTRTSTVHPTPTTTSTTDWRNSGSGSGTHYGVFVGIIVGSVIGGLLILGALSAVLILYRRNRNNDNTPQEPAIGPFSYVTSPKPGPSEVASTAQHVAPGVSELGFDNSARPWSIRSELQGNQSGLPVSMATSETVSPQQSPPLGGHGQPGLGPSMTHPSVISPQHSNPTGSIGSYDEANKPGPDPQAFSPFRHHTIYELPG